MTSQASDDVGSEISTTTTATDRALIRIMKTRQN
ncbi:hypothetical protein T4E_10229 [Trichinella pseudospiralis]|uniref:Uncharacterized protein n=1 Tax=Trichinella pseudospiralis TaxID=6337 RepID=A0A0V0W7W9_TRIPS|nr:hypothetical protein T4E_10229 [Trichinella pseudospiralis]